jgi:hypothetical protein
MSSKDSVKAISDVIETLYFQKFLFAVRHERHKIV